MPMVYIVRRGDELDVFESLSDAEEASITIGGFDTDVIEESVFPAADGPGWAGIDGSDTRGFLDDLRAEYLG